MLALCLVQAKPNLSAHYQLATPYFWRRNFQRVLIINKHTRSNNRSLIILFDKFVFVERVCVWPYWHSIDLLCFLDLALFCIILDFTLFQFTLRVCIFHVSFWVKNIIFFRPKKIGDSIEKVLDLAALRVKRKNQENTLRFKKMLQHQRHIFLI